MLGPIIEGERIRLVPTASEMLPNFVRWFADTRVTQYLGSRFVPSAKMEEEWLDKITRSENDVVWAIFVGEKHIGATGIHQIHWKNRRAITGTMIGETAEWGKGYGSETAKLRTRFAFEELGLEKLMTEAIMENTASRRALEKAGYVQYGIARRHDFRGGKWHDMWLGEVLRDDWLESQRTASSTNQ